MQEHTKTDVETAPLGKRAQKRQETTQRILDTSMDILIREGHRGFTIAKLAKEMGYAVGALYRYFRGKDAILAALQRDVVARLEADFIEATAYAEETLADAEESHRALVRLFVTLDCYDSLLIRRPTDFQVLALSLGDPTPFMAKDIADARLVPAYRSLLERIGAEIRTCVDLGVFEDGSTRERIVALWGGTIGVVSLRKLARFEELLASRNVSANLYITMARGFGAADDAAQAAFSEARRLCTALHPKLTKADADPNAS